MPPTPFARDSRPLSAYVNAIRATTTEATSLHREWRLKLAQLVTALETDAIDQALARTNHVGMFFDLSFARCRRHLATWEPPRSARAFHDFWLAWLDHMVEANRALASAAHTHDSSNITRCRGILIEAREVLRELGAEADRLEVEVGRERREFAA